MNADHLLRRTNKALEARLREMGKLLETSTSEISRLTAERDEFWRATNLAAERERAQTAVLEDAAISSTAVSRFGCRRVVSKDMSSYPRSAIIRIQTLENNMRELSRSLDLAVRETGAERREKAKLREENRRIKEAMEKTDNERDALERARITIESRANATRGRKINRGTQVDVEEMEGSSEKSQRTGRGVCSTSSLLPDMFAHIRGLEQRVHSLSQQLQHSSQERDRMRQASHQQLALHASTHTAFKEVVRERDEARELQEIARSQRDGAREAANSSQKDELIAKLHDEAFVVRHSLERVVEQLAAVRAERDELARTIERLPSHQRANQRRMSRQQKLAVQAEKRFQLNLMHLSTRSTIAKNARARKTASLFDLDNPSEEHSPAVRPEELPPSEEQSSTVKAEDLPLVRQAEASGIPTESDIKKEEPVKTCDVGQSWKRNEHDHVPLYNSEMTVPKEEDEAGISVEQGINRNHQFFARNSPASGDKAESRPRKRKPT